MSCVSSFASTALNWIASPGDGHQAIARGIIYNRDWKNRLGMPLSNREKNLAFGASFALVFLETLELPEKVRSLFKPVRVYQPGTVGLNESNRSFFGEGAKKATDLASFLARSADVAVYAVDYELVSLSKKVVNQLKILSLASFCYMGVHGLCTEAAKTYTIWTTGKVTQARVKGDVEEEIDRPFQLGLDGVQLLLKTIESVALVVFSTILIAELVGFVVPYAGLSVLVSTTALTVLSTFRYFWEKIGVDAQFEAADEFNTHDWLNEKG